MLNGKRILLIISGGIAAYKCLELIRRLKERGVSVRCILTKSGAEFVTPLSVATLSEQKVYQDLFSLTDESEIGHIRLSREADLLVVAPATANILAKMAQGIADDLASTCLLATDKPVMIVPAMNGRMWSHAATQANVKALEQRGLIRIGPGAGEMAERGESGLGRLAEPLEILAEIENFFRRAERLNGRTALVTSGPTHEPIDPVRYIANRSSGKQGHAIAKALRRMGAATTLVSGPSAEPDPEGVTVIHVETAREMFEACLHARDADAPLDVAVCAAAVADWRIDKPAEAKLKKDRRNKPPVFTLAENPDILASLSAAGVTRPRLVVGFAAETENVIGNAHAKRERKGCDWIVANDVSRGAFGADDNTVHLITARGEDSWPRLGKQAVADKLAFLIADHLDAAS
ncbi:MAG: bifunctional phosphopantothenoylcysteine decarboxylase/phosphopantothenate--cysteine ligase CoaBC [Rhodospirillales bacterium]